MYENLFLQKFWLTKTEFLNSNLKSLCLWEAILIFLKARPLVEKVYVNSPLQAKTTQTLKPCQEVGHQPLEVAFKGPLEHCLAGLSCLQAPLSSLNISDCDKEIHFRHMAFAPQGPQPSSICCPLTAWPWQNLYSRWPNAPCSPQKDVANERRNRRKRKIDVKCSKKLNIWFPGQVKNREGGEGKITKLYFHCSLWYSALLKNWHASWQLFYSISTTGTLQLHVVIPSSHDPCHPSRGGWGGKYPLKPEALLGQLTYIKPKSLVSIKKV